MEELAYDIDFGDSEIFLQHRSKKPWYKPNFSKETYKIYDGDGFDSDFESFCATRLNMFLENIIEEHKLSYQVKYFEHKRHTCDFVLEYNNTVYWIEVSTYNLQVNKKYAKKIEIKRNWINERGDNNVFIFVNNKREMNSFISELKN